MTKPFLLIDNTMTMHGVRFLMDGGRWERFKKNPVMLYMHTRGKVVGKWIDLQYESGAWKATPVFDLKDSFAAGISRQVSDGFLNACSIGVQIHKAEKTGENEIVITEWEPYECSIVDAGSNVNALQLYTGNGEKIADTEQYIKNLTLSINSQPQQLSNKMLNKLIPRNILMAMEIIEPNASNESIVKAIEGLLIKNLRMELDANPTHQKTQNQIVDDVEKDKEEFDKLWKSGELMSLKIKNPEKFKKLYKSTFGVDPVSDEDAVKEKPAPLEVRDSYNGIKEDREEYDELWRNGGLEALKRNNLNKFRRLFRAANGVDPEA